MKEARHKGHILDEFIHMKYPEQANPQREEAD